MADRHVVVVLSGGLDSTTLAFQTRAEGDRVTALSVDYGQRHGAQELRAATAIATAIGVPHEVVDLSPLRRLLSGSALTDDAVEVPDGHYTHQSMRVTVVPNRNALLLDLAVALAVARRADAVAIGAHSGDHPIYPDCRPEFISAFQRAARLANAGFLPDEFEVLAPFAGMSKTDIVRLGAGLHVPFDVTWSCYHGGDEHCGVCGTCVERREAFAEAGVPDPTSYTEVRQPCT